MTVQLIPSVDLSLADSSTNDGGASVLVGLSACLEGQEVRYNGGHTRSRLCLDVLAKHFQFETFCPEVAAGFGTPRPVMRLIGDPDKPTLTFTHDETVDLSNQLINGFADSIDGFARLDGYILMKNSPSCGLERIKVYQTNGYPHEKKGRGLFAAALKDRYPLLPIEEEGRLHDKLLYENFILRVYAHHNFRKEVALEPSLHKLIAFHSSYKYLLMAHDQDYYRSLGAMLADPKIKPLDLLLERYFIDFMAAISKPADAKNHSNVLFHILGYLKKSVDSAARQHIAEVINRYRVGEVPLVVPLVLLKHYIEREGSDYIRMQRYLQPYPDDLGLANNV